MKVSGIQIKYLDANFPFFNQFPLLPHLSHNDGKKLDISLVYETSNGLATNLKKSNSGYGVFEGPIEDERNQIELCKANGKILYDFSKYLTFGKTNQNLKLSNKITKKLIECLLQAPQLEKIFIEPHLKHRLKLSDHRIRYQGSHSVRHDDHIHLQIK